MPRRMDIENKLIGKMKAPRSNVILVLHDEIAAYNETPGGLLVPAGDEARMSNERAGTVISAGDKIGALRAGDRVYLDKRNGIPIPHNDMALCKLVMVSQDQIWGMLTGDAEREDFDLHRDGVSL